MPPSPSPPSRAAPARPAPVLARGSEPVLLGGSAPQAMPRNLGESQEWLRIADAWQKTRAGLAGSASLSRRDLAGMLNLLSEARADVNKLLAMGLITDATADMLRLGLGMLNDCLQDAPAANDGKPPRATEMLERLKRVTPELNRLAASSDVTADVRSQVRTVLNQRIANTKAVLNAAPELVDNAAVDAIDAALAVATKLSTPPPGAPGSAAGQGGGGAGQGTAASEQGLGAGPRANPAERGAGPAAPPALPGEVAPAQGGGLAAPTVLPALPGGVAPAHGAPAQALPVQRQLPSRFTGRVVEVQ